MCVSLLVYTFASSSGRSQVQVLKWGGDVVV